uniref:Uncharacterized protein n=1 Tax=Arundo donax TaxID=35708 RepID=A0A0A8Y302_ARUDO
MPICNFNVYIYQVSFYNQHPHDQTRKNVSAINLWYIFS